MPPSAGSPCGAPALRERSSISPAARSTRRKPAAWRATSSAGPATLAADLAEHRRDPERGRRRRGRARARPDQQVAQSIRLGQLAASGVHRSVAGLLDPGERNERLVHVAAVHVHEGVGARDHLGRQPMGEALGRRSVPVARELAVQVEPVERVDVDRASGEGRGTRGEHRDERARHGRRIEVKDDLAQRGDRHVLGAVDPGGDGDAGARARRRGRSRQAPQGSPTRRRRARGR